MVVENKAPNRAIWRVVLVAALAAALFILGYRSIRKTCCGDELSEVQLNDLVRSAGAGDVAAMKRLFFYFDEHEDPVKASLWLKRAADAGDPEGAMFIYDRLIVSRAVSEKELAIDYLRKAARGGSSTAQVVLGESYRDGSGVPKDMEAAVYWLRAGALAGDADGILAFCDLALLERNRTQCEECLKMIDTKVSSLDRQSHLARELLARRKRIALELGSSRLHPRGPSSSGARE